MKIPRNKELREEATYLRNNATKEQKHLWYDFLRTYPVQFYRQRILGDFVVDFYCPKARLAIEIVDDVHYSPSVTQNDAARSVFFRQYGIKLIRINKKTLWRYFPYVCERINICVNERLTQNKKPYATHKAVNPSPAATSR